MGDSAARPSLGTNRVPGMMDTEHIACVGVGSLRGAPLHRDEPNTACWCAHERRLQYVCGHAVAGVGGAVTAAVTAAGRWPCPLWTLSACTRGQAPSASAYRTSHLSPEESNIVKWDWDFSARGVCNDAAIVRGAGGERRTGPTARATRERPSMDTHALPNTAWIPLAQSGRSRRIRR